MNSKVGVALLVALTGLVVSLVAPAAASAQELARDDPDAAQELADRYSPVIMLKAQEAPCDPDGEPYGPTSIDIVLDNPEILLRQLGPNNPVVKVAPTAADLHGLGQGFFVDFPGSALAPGCIYEKDFEKYSAGLPATVYAHIVQQPDHPDQLALQYWFYWYYNDWNNKHESDWEGIQILFDASSIDEALASEPVSVGYAQHEGGERADWDSSKLERDGEHPFVYSSAGSHASYFGSAHYMGRSGGEGFGCDNTDGPSERVDPEVVVLPDAPEGPDDPLAWLAFEGRWGERQSGPFNGPTGPAAKGRWLDPIDWHEGLRSASVVIPSGDSQAELVINSFCDLVEWGSGILIEFTTSPTKLILSMAIAIALIAWLIRRTEWNLVPWLPVRRRRHAGQIMRTAAHTGVRHPGELLGFGLIYLPTAIIVGAIGGIAATLPLLRELLDLAGTVSGTGAFVGLMVGGLANLAAYVAVNAMVAEHLDQVEKDSEHSIWDAAKATWARRGPLFFGLVRATAIVGVLFISVVGVPWGIRQLVRYQFLPQVAMLENRGGRDSLDRSSELVIGRWWHTAVMIGTFNVLVAVSGMIVGLLVLVLFSSIPLWGFSAIVTLIYAVIVPVTALGQTLLYGDAVAESEGAEHPEPISV